jgi:cytochrome c-type biogenesis protein
VADSLLGLVVLPVALGLLGFAEPCTIGSSLLFVHYVEGRPRREQVLHTFVFAFARAALMGVLGAAAVFVGVLFVDLQKAAWAIMGAIYLALGFAYLTGNIDRLKQPLGLSLRRLEGSRGAATVGLVFAFNIPACAGPLLAVLLGTAAVAEAGNWARGFLMLGLFGLALSAPIAVAVLSSTGRRLLDRLAGYARSAPRIIGGLFVLLGAWSIRFALVAEVI